MTEQQRLWSVVPLVMMAGAVDAIGWLRMDEMFVGMITGNTTLAGVAVADREFHRIGNLLLLVGLFMVGCLAGAVLGHYAKRWRTAAVLSAVAVLVCIAVFLPFEGELPAAVFALSPAMGMVNTAVPGVGGITFLTGTTVRAMQAIVTTAFGQTPRWSWAPHLAAVVGLFIGATLGALLERAFGHWALLAPAFGAAVGAALIVGASLRAETTAKA